MGFWHTGYIEHHEDAGLGDNWHPAPTVYRCLHCSFQFETEAELRKHRFETHPYTQPSLFFRGIELGASPVYVRRKINPGEIFLATCTHAHLNGEVISVGDLPTRLSHIRSDRVTIKLSNAGASASYDIHFQIADARDLDRVDEAFQRLAKCGVLSISSLDDFIIQCRPFATAAPYLDGIAHYLYGVLAKERAPDSTVPHDKYSDRFNAAVAALADYERPLANLIRALVAFNFNHFQEAAVGADVDLSHMPICDCAIANELRTAPGLNFCAFQPAHRKPGAWLKSASAHTIRQVSSPGHSVGSGARRLLRGVKSSSSTATSRNAMR